jgi:hypothetical protein
MSYSNEKHITLGPYYYPYLYMSSEKKENKYGIKERNIEGITKVLKLKNNEINILLSILEMGINTNKIILQI